VNDGVRVVQMEHAETAARRAEEAADISLGSAAVALKAAKAMPTPTRQDVRDKRGLPAAGDAGSVVPRTVESAPHRRCDDHHCSRRDRRRQQGQCVECAPPLRPVAAVHQAAPEQSLLRLAPEA